MVTGLKNSIVGGVADWITLRRPGARCYSPHYGLNEGICGHFNMTAEQLEARAVEYEKKRVETKAVNATNYYYKQMEKYYDEYMTKANERVYKSRVLHGQRGLRLLLLLLLLLLA
jgi:hypothetical protein